MAGKKGGVEQSQHHLPRDGSSGNTRGCCLKGDISFFRRSVKTAYLPCCTPLPQRGSPRSALIPGASQQAGGKPAAFTARELWLVRRKLDLAPTAVCVLSLQADPGGQLRGTGEQPGAAPAPGRHRARGHCHQAVLVPRTSNTGPLKLKQLEMEYVKLLRFTLSIELSLLESRAFLRKA